MLKEDKLIEQLSVIEDELIEDYARNALNASDRKQFEHYFLSNPKRRRKLMLVRGLRKYTADIGYVSPADEVPPRPWYFPLLSPQWRAVIAAVLIVIAGVGIWRFYVSRRSDVEKGLLALNEAYKINRPIAVRVTGLNYAPFSVTRGSTQVNSRDLDRAAALLHNAASDKPSPEALHALGRLYLLNRDFDKAVVQYEEALKSIPNDARLHSDLGAALLEKGKLERATDQSGRSETTLAESLGHLNRALELDNSLPDARFNRALLYEEMKLIPQALEDWNKYVALDPDSPWADEARRRIEELQKRKEKISERDKDRMLQFSNALTKRDLENMWELFSGAHLRSGNSITNKLIDSYLTAATTPGRSEEAAQWSQALVDLGKLSSDKTGDSFTADLAQAYRSATPGQLQTLVQARKSVATAYELYSQAKNDLAIPHYNSAKSSFAKVGDHPEALLASFWLSFCTMERGDVQAGLSLLQEVERASVDRNYKWLRAITQIGLAAGYERKTEYSQAVDHSWASYRESKQIGDKTGELRSLNMLAGLYRDMGNYRRALVLAQQGLSLGTKIFANDHQLIGFYATSAWSLNSLGYYPAALEYEKQALSIGESMDNPLVRSRYRVQMGMIQGKLKNYDEAIRNIRLGIEAGQSVGEETIRQEMSNYGQLYLGRAYRESQRFTEALATLAEVENFSRRSDDQVWLLHAVKKEQLLTHIAQGNVAAAREELARVLSDYEDQRQTILEESNRGTFFDQEQSIYDVAIDFTHAADSQQAFDYSESSRARSLLDASAGNWQLAEGDKIPDLRFVSASKPMSLVQLRQHLPDHAQVLQFAVLQDRLLIWYLTRDRFETASVNISGDALRIKVDRLLNLVTTPPVNDDKQLQRLSGELYDLLIGPLAQFLDRQKQLCIVPDKILNLLPFNVLFSTPAQRYLVEDFAVIYSSSANVFARDSKLANEKRDVRMEVLLGVGNPRFDRKAFPDLSDLPSAAREVEDIGQFYNGHASLLRGPEARKTSVLAGMRNADVLHLAAHYVPDANWPMLGKLLLAGESFEHDSAQKANGVLHVYEVYRLKPLRSRLAVLAGCQTGVEGYINGEGSIGLARPFNAAGVPLVIASLWPVDSMATTELMIEFHRLRRQTRLSTADALRGAQVHMLKQENTGRRSPYYWASFALIGGYSDY
ncbi:MAG TPA: CHAT domain-containing protein [Pyrinomonadaceae bacterium]